MKEINIKITHNLAPSHEYLVIQTINETLSGIKSWCKSNSKKTLIIERNGSKA